MLLLPQANNIDGVTLTTDGARGDGVSQYVPGVDVGPDFARTLDAARPAATGESLPPHGNLLPSRGDLIVGDLTIEPGAQRAPLAEHVVSLALPSAPLVALSTQPTGAAEPALLAENRMLPAITGNAAGLRNPVVLLRNDGTAEPLAVAGLSRADAAALQTQAANPLPAVNTANRTQALTVGDRPATGADRHAALTLTEAMTAGQTGKQPAAALRLPQDARAISPAPSLPLPSPSSQVAVRGAGSGGSHDAAANFADLRESRVPNPGARQESTAPTLPQPRQPSQQGPQRFSESLPAEPGTRALEFPRRAMNEHIAVSAERPAVPAERPVAGVEYNLRTLQRMLSAQSAPAPASGSLVPVSLPEETGQRVQTGATASPTPTGSPPLAAAGDAARFVRGTAPRAAATNSLRGDGAVRAVADALQLAQPVPRNELQATPAVASPAQQPVPVAPPELPELRRQVPAASTVKTATTSGTTASPVTAGPEPAVAESQTVQARPDGVAVAALPGSPAPASTAAPATSQQHMHLPVTASNWGDALGERLAVLAAQKISSAEIRLNPAEMGPLRVEIRIDEGNAQVQFMAQHAVTREALEQALPRLRELFAAEGLNLTGADVSDDGVAKEQGGQAQHAHTGEPALAPTGAEEQGAGEPEHGPRATAHDGQVDTFA